MKNSCQVDLPTTRWRIGFIVIAYIDTIEAIHIAVSRVNCFDVRHFLLLFLSRFALSVWAESVFSRYIVDFVDQCLFIIFLNVR